MVATLFGLASLGLNWLYRRRHPDSALPHLWVAREDEADAVAEPLARMAERRVDMTAGQANDLSDGIEAAVAVGGYAMRNVEERAAHAAPVAQPPKPEGEQ